MMGIGKYATARAPSRALGLVAAVALAMTFAGSAGAASAVEPAVKIANFTFDPPTLTVPVGATVTWTNDDDIPHVVAEKDGKFRSKALDTGDTFSRQFTSAGTVEYCCAIHPHMTGKIIVTP
jgi:plastocyanin